MVEENGEGGSGRGSLRRRAQDVGCVISYTVYTAPFQASCLGWVNVCVWIGWCGGVASRPPKLCP